MAETFVELVEEWQTGALFVFATVIGGGVLGIVAASSFGPVAGLVGFVAGAVVVFAVISYLLYGR
ncbi:hypothetical protein [Haloarcula laminariae]|uniref:hypothetical protein n=1 Tax=Haloarcula laminariae TaxID=2961577 RepID=UPI0021C68901|nr:hypothetical protein [Halomicroarcula laminariae]